MPPALPREAPPLNLRGGSGGDGLALLRGRPRLEAMGGAEDAVRVDGRLDPREARERVVAERIADRDPLLGEVQVRLATRPGRECILDRLDAPLDRLGRAGPERDADREQRVRAVESAECAGARPALP